MSIWAICEGNKHLCSFDLFPWRVVEDQHTSSTRDLVDTREEHELLEELLEASKPPVAKTQHYLIFTPFRYPPLKYGSRFGQVYEVGVWYGSIELKAALAEVAYYRLKFFEDSHANLGYIEIPMTAFNACISTQKGIDLTKLPFQPYESQISDQDNYTGSQSLGTDMRKSGVEVFIYTSARAKNAKNVGAFIPTVFKKKKDQYIANMQNWRCFASKDTIEFTRHDIVLQIREIFSKTDFT